MPPADTPATPLTTTAAPAATATTATTTTPAAPTLPEFAKDWGVVPEVGEWLAKAGYKTAADFASSAMATKKMVGRDPTDYIAKPKEGDSAARLAAMRALGAPEKAAEYGFELPKGGDAQFMEAAASKLAELGIPKAEATALFGWWNEYVSTQAGSLEEAAEAKRAGEWAALREELGDDYGRTAAAAQAAAREVGLTAEQGLALERALGVKEATAMMAKLGKHFVEAAFKGVGDTTGGTGAHTVETAQAKLADLRGDKAFVARWAAGDVDARKQIDQLVAFIAANMPTPATANATPATQFGNRPAGTARTATS